MNYKTYHKDQKLSHVKVSTILILLASPAFVDSYKNLPGISNLMIDIIGICFLLGITTKLILDLLLIDITTFIRQKKVVYFPASEVINLPGFKATHFIENTRTIEINYKSDLFKSTPMFEKIKINNKDYIALTKIVIFGDNSKRYLNYLAVDENDNYITEIPKDFKHIKPEAKTFKYYTKYTRRGFLPIITDITNAEK